MSIPFLSNITIDDAGHIQFKTAAGANSGKIETNGNDLVLSNAVGDIIIGNGSDDVFIGDGTNTVDIRFEQNMAIFADSSSTRTLTLGGANTSLILESPTINGSVTLGSTTINNKLTFTSANGYILFDHEPSGDTGPYEGSTSVPLLKVDKSGSELTILERTSDNGAILLGNDDSVIIAAGDTRSVMRANINEAAETVFFAAEGGFQAYGFPSNTTDWSNRVAFEFRAYDGTAANNGLYIGDGGQTQFIDLSRNLKNIGTVTASGKISGGEIEGTSLDINGAADVSGNAVFHGKTGFGGATTTYNVHAKGTGWAGTGIAIESTTTNGAVLSLFNTARQFQIASRGGTLDFRDVTASDTVRFIVDSNGHLLPGADSSYNLGSNGTRWSNIYADTLYGDGSNITNVSSTDSTKVAKSGDTMTGNLSIDSNNAVIFDNANNNNAWYIRNGGTSSATLQFGLGSPGSNIKHVFEGNGNIDFGGDVTVKGSHLTLQNGTAYAQATDYLYIGGSGLDNADAAIYLGNRGDGNSYGWRFLYKGTGSGNGNNLVIQSENANSPVDALTFNQNGVATFANNISVTGNISVSGTVDGVDIAAFKTSFDNLSIPSISGLASESYVDTAVANVVDSAPAALDTLNELAAALGDDANFSTTIATSIGGKVSKAGDTMTGNLTISKTSPTITLNNTAGGGLDPILQASSTNFTISTTSITALTLALDTGNAAFNGYVSATQFRPTNIVTNKVVKFSGTALDDSNITDTGSLITLDSDVTVGDELTITTISNATADPDKFLCASGSNKIGYRTGAQVLSDIGALAKAGGTMTGDIQMSANKVKFDESGVRSWNLYSDSGNLNVTSGDADGNLNVGIGLIVAKELDVNGTGSSTFAGNVGIKDNPSFSLDVNVASSRARFKAATGDANIELSSIAGHDYLIQSKSDSSFVIYDEDESSERLKIDSSGNSTFAGAITTNANNTFKSAAGSGQGIELNLIGTNTSGFGSSHVVKSRIKTITDDSANAYASKLEFYTNDASNNLDLALKLDSSQNATFAGQVLVKNDNGLRLNDTADSTTSRTTLSSATNGGNSKMLVKGGNFLHNVDFETSKNDFKYANLKASYNGGTSELNLYQSNSDTTSTAATTTISTGDSVFAGNVTLSAGNIIFGSQYGIRFNDANTRIYTNTDNPEDLIIEADQDLIIAPDGQVTIAGNVAVTGTVDGVDISGLPTFTTVGTAFAELSDVSIPSYIRVNADETLSYLNSTQFLTAIGGTSFDGAYSSLSGIPSSFTPAQHTQAISTITGLQNALDGKLSLTGGTMTGNIYGLGRIGGTSGQNEIDFSAGKITFTSASTSLAAMSSTYFRPNTDDSIELGTSGRKWKRLHATNISGELDGTISSSTTATTQSQGNNSTKVATTAYVDAAIENTQTILFSNFSDDGSTTSSIRIPFNSLTESSSNQYYNHFDCPSDGTIKRIRMQNTSGSLSTGFTTIFDIFKNVSSGSPTQSSGSLGASNGAIEYAPNLTFSKGDAIQIAYRKSAGGKYWRGVSASIIIEFEQV